jgi:hypothetical protein
MGLCRVTVAGVPRHHLPDELLWVSDRRWCWREHLGYFQNLCLSEARPLGKAARTAWMLGRHHRWRSTSERSWRALIVLDGEPNVAGMMRTLLSRAASESLTSAARYRLPPGRQGHPPSTQQKVRRRLCGQVAEMDADTADMFPRTFWEDYIGTTGQARCLHFNF